MKRLLAFILALALFVGGVWGYIGVSQAQLKAAVGIEGALIKPFYNSPSAIRRTFGEQDVVLMGSSELTSSHGTGYHPNALLKNTDRKVYNIGSGGTQSLYLATAAAAIGDALPQKKMVFSISYQWFTADGVKPDAFASNFSLEHYTAALANPRLSDDTKALIAARSLGLLAAAPGLQAKAATATDASLKHQVLPKAISSVRMGFMTIDAIHDALKAYTPNAPQVKPAVNVTNPDEVERVISELNVTGSEKTDGNDFYVDSHYFTTYMEKIIDQLKNNPSDKYSADSFEFEDFKLFLKICSELEIKPLILLQPVNGWWYDYVGESKDVRIQYYQQIKKLCAEVDAEVADFSNMEYEPYFLKDIMHVGEKGWVMISEKMDRFYD